MNPGEIVYSGQLLVALPLALLAGFVSFASPCVLPVIPGYLGLLGAVSDSRKRDESADAQDADASATQAGAVAAPARGRVALGAALFVLGFSVIYVLSGAAFGQLGVWFLRYQHTITPILGAIVALMGLVFVGLSGPWQRTMKFNAAPAGLVGAPILGAIFALGWAPCLGPTLVAIQSLSFEGASAGRGALLAFAYCLGLGIPFVLAAVFWSSATGWIGWLKRHLRTINIIGGVLLIIIGLLMMTGLWQQFVSAVGAMLPGYQAPL
ncbi:cytochrome c biogenesis CcdA family protein [Gulosibacter bifidus]|uniref:Cytochrome c biogenesis CcdA family protein n=1 Tax=Gulosibacter bifidus TaxID=272239 RepID=A0ABW5RKF8_9MICO|nr:cytochrome c biogenesis protein CcdA [Gulosibacter bifidus]